MDAALASPSLADSDSRPIGAALIGLFLGYPIWWALGFGAFVWPVFAALMLVSLLPRGREVVAPAGFALWIMFLAWMLASALRLDDAQRLYVFTYRALLYGSATALFLYVYNAPRRLLPSQKVVGLLAIFFGFVVAGGYLGIFLPRASFRTLAEALMPRSLVANQWVHDLVHVRFAQTQVLTSGPVTRPSAPFTYTNEWGAYYAILLPFALYASSRQAPVKWRLPARVVLAISVVPLILSGNRGAWLAVGLAALYGTARLVARDGIRALAWLLLGLVALGSLVAGTPLGRDLQARFVHSQSNESRLSLYGQATEQTMDSPLFGYGAPRPSEQNPNLPSVGTHGQLWLVLFSHGIPGAAFFVGWFVLTWWRTRGGDSRIRFWANLAIFVGVVELSYYDLLPTGLHLIMVASALAWREPANPPNRAPRWEPGSVAQTIVRAAPGALR